MNEILIDKYITMFSIVNVVHVVSVNNFNLTYVLIFRV